MGQPSRQGIALFSVRIEFWRSTTFPSWRDSSTSFFLILTSHQLSVNMRCFLLTLLHFDRDNSGVRLEPRSPRDLETSWLSAATMYQDRGAGCTGPDRTTVAITFLAMTQMIGNGKRSSNVSSAACPRKCVITRLKTLRRNFVECFISPSTAER